MAMGFGAAGMAGGIGRGLENVAGMLNNYTMQNMQNTNAAEMQQNNPYVRLAAMKGLGAGSAGTGVTGSAADIGSQRMNPETYGKPGHPGGISDPAGNFDPATIPLFGEEHKGLQIAAGGREQFQNSVVPIANAYIKTKSMYDGNMEKVKQLEQVVTQNRAKMQTEVAKITGSMAPGTQEYNDAILGVREKYAKDEMSLKQIKEEMGGLEQALQEYGGKLSQVLPGLDLGQGGLVAEEVANVDQQQAGVRPPQVTAAPQDLAKRIFPPGQAPASMMTRGYNPVTPHDPRR